MHRLRRAAAAEGGRLLRVLLLRLRPLPAHSSRAIWRVGRSLLRPEVTIVPSDGAQPSRDWVGRTRTRVIAWWIPQGALLAALLVSVPLRTPIWILALVWMGTACVLNARGCNRTHCRYTGPYYLAMIAPVIVLGSGMVAIGFAGWLILASIILLGGKLIWWATERAWGKFS
jgi:hypothetical protein